MSELVYGMIFVAILAFWVGYLIGCLITYDTCKRYHDQVINDLE